MSFINMKKMNVCVSGHIGRDTSQFLFSRCQLNILVDILRKLILYSEALGWSRTRVTNVVVLASKCHLKLYN